MVCKDCNEGNFIRKSDMLLLFYLILAGYAFVGTFMFMVSVGNLIEVDAISPWERGAVVISGLIVLFTTFLPNAYNFFQR